MSPRNEANCGLVPFSLVLQAFRAVLGPSNPNSPFILLGQGRTGRAQGYGRAMEGRVCVWN